MSTVHPNASAPRNTPRACQPRPIAAAAGAAGAKMWLNEIERYACGNVTKLLVVEVQR
jgi:hypothetical protein